MRGHEHAATSSNMPAARGKPVALTATDHGILLALAGDESDGTGILRAIAARTGRRAPLGPGALYRHIERLLAARLIAEAGTHPDHLGRPHRLYRLTAAGGDAAATEAARRAGAVTDPPSGWLPTPGVVPTTGGAG